MPMKALLVYIAADNSAQDTRKPRIPRCHLYGLAAMMVTGLSSLHALADSEIILTNMSGIYTVCDALTAPAINVVGE